MSSKTGTQLKLDWLWNIQKFRNRLVIVRFKNGGQALRGRLIEYSVCNITVKQGWLWWSKKSIIPYGEISHIQKASWFHSERA